MRKIVLGATTALIACSALVLTSAAAPASNNAIPESKSLTQSAEVAAQFGPQLYYSYEFYSDASHTSMVGYYYQTCVNGTIYTPMVTGTTSPYYVREAIGRCPGLGPW